MLLRVSCLGPVRCLACLSGGGGPVPFPPCLALGCVPPFERPLRACGRGCRCGGCERVDTSPTPQRALLRAGFARCGGGTRAPGEGASCLGVGCPGWGALPTPTARPLGACSWGAPPTGCGCGGCGLGDSSPNPQRALLRADFARCGGGARAPREGASCLGVWCLGSDALRPPTARPLGRAPGAYYPLALGAGGAGVGTRHQTHSLRSWELACRALGAARRRPGGRLLRGCGASGVGRSPTPDRPSLGACGRGPPLTGCGCGRCGFGDPVTKPTARALASWLCAPWGRHGGAPGGVPPAWVWGIRARALPHA